MRSEVITGNNIDTLKKYPDNYFDSVITDPPYGIEFLAKDWDSNTGAIETWEQVFRVLKPGGYLLAFSAARTYHHLATNIESVGFEIRDQIMWIYSSGFPKAQDVGKNIHKRQNKEKSYTISEDDIPKLTLIQADRYLHPDGYEVRKLPNTKGSGAADQYGGGKWASTYERVVTVNNKWAGWKTALKPAHEPIVMARKPFKGSTVDNVIKHGVGAMNIDATRISDQDRYPSNIMGEISDEYQKYFYCAKVSRAERHIGESGNDHPTVKPIALMRYLVTLVTPDGGKVLDPFTGSGSTGMAVVELGMEFTGCELDPDYADISRSRIQAWYNKTDVSGEDLPPEWFDEAH